MLDVSELPERSSCVSACPDGYYAEKGAELSGHMTVKRCRRMPFLLDILQDMRFRRGLYGLQGGAALNGQKGLESVEERRCT